MKIFLLTVFLVLGLGCVRHSTDRVNIEQEVADVVPVSSLAKDTLIIFENVDGNSATLSVFMEDLNLSRTYLVKDYVYQHPDETIGKLLYDSNISFEAVLVYTN